MGFVNTLFLTVALINVFNNITLICSRKFDNHGESRSFIGFGTHTAVERSCASNTTTFYSCCEAVKILYTFKVKKLCFNMIYQANVLNVDLSLDSLILKSMTVASYRPFKMCAEIPGVLFTTACVTITEITAFTGSTPSVTVCPRLELSTKKETWNISYRCSTLMANGAAGGMGMVMVMPPMVPGAQMPPTPGAQMPPMPGAQMALMPGGQMIMKPVGGQMAMMPAAQMFMMPGGQMAMVPGAPPASGATGAAAGMAAMPTAPAQPPAGPMPAMAGPPPAMSGPQLAPTMAGPPPAPAMAGAPPAMAGAPPAMAGAPPTMAGAPPAMVGAPPAMGSMPSAALTVAKPPAPGVGVVPVKPPASAAGAMPSASPLPAASTMVPRILGAAESPVYVVLMNQHWTSALESVMPEASASMTMGQENQELSAESRVNSGITTLESETDLNNDSESYKQNLKMESKMETKKKFPNLKRKKRDIFDILHQNNRCERAYRICVTRSKHYVISRLKNTKQNLQIKNDDCINKLVRIVHEPDRNLCSELNWDDHTSPSQPTNPPSVSQDSIIHTDDSLSAIVIQDEYSEGSDFHPQNSQYPIPLLTYTNGEMYPSRIPPIALKELRSANDSIILKENLENLNNDKSIVLAIKK